MTKIKCKDEFQNVSISMTTITNISIPILATNSVQIYVFHPFPNALNVIESFDVVPLR